MKVERAHDDLSDVPKERPCRRHGTEYLAHDLTTGRQRCLGPGAPNSCKQIDRSAPTAAMLDDMRRLGIAQEEGA